MSFCLNLSVLKAINWSSITSNISLYLATMIIAMCQPTTTTPTTTTTSSSKDEFITVLDRLASSPDFGSVKDGLLVFLTKTMLVLPSG